MKPGAVLINTARGELVDEGALAEAVREKRIAGAAIDVFAVEPLPADSPLRQLDRVILTPHLAASTAEAQERVSLEICTAVRESLVSGDLSFAINVPGISGDVLRRLGPLLDLARRLSRLALALVDGPVASVEVAYGGKDEAAPRPGVMGAGAGRRRAVRGEAGLLGQAGINIGSYHQARRDAPGQEALAAITVDQALTNGVLDQLGRIPDILQVRLADLG